MKNLELQSLSCACCGAKLENFQGKDEMSCEFCDNVTRIIRPVIVAASNSLDSGKKDSFNNIVTIIEQSMLAENYKEAYDYCNKALEIDPSCSSLWENKAICCFWLRTDNDIIESQAKEITTYLNAAKNNDSNSSTYQKTVDNLAFNLYFAAWYRYTIVQPDTMDAANKYTMYSHRLCKKIVAYMNMMEIAFDLSPNEIYLKEAVEELSNLKKVRWIIEKNGVFTNVLEVNVIGTNTVKLRERFISKIKNINPDYQPPAVGKKPGCFIATAVMNDYEHPLVIDLRLFRDKWLLQKDWGKKFTESYYTHGPKFAEVIEESNFLKFIAYIFIVKPLHILVKAFGFHK
jgi:tetratricopeptide (TPR) repeat protein